MVEPCSALGYRVNAIDCCGALYQAAGKQAISRDQSDALVVALAVALLVSAGREGFSGESEEPFSVGGPPKFGVRTIIQQQFESSYDGPVTGEFTD